MSKDLLPVVVTKIPEPADCVPLSRDERRVKINLQCQRQYRREAEILETLKPMVINLDRQNADPQTTKTYHENTNPMVVQ